MAARVSQVTVQLAEQITSAKARATQVTVMQGVIYTYPPQARVTMVTALYAKGPAAGGGMLLRGLGS